MYGMGNWAEIAEHVRTKSKEQCIHHYNDAYMNSPYFPLPDMTRAVEKNREELLAMAKGEGEDKKGWDNTPILIFNILYLGNLINFQIKESHKNGSSSQLLSGMNAASQTRGLNVVYEHQVHSNYTNIAGTKGIEKASNVAQVKNSPKSVKLEDHVSDRSFGGKKPKSLEDEGPFVMELSSYNPKRQEFDIEYDNDAEQLLAEILAHRFLITFNKVKITNIRKSSKYIITRMSQSGMPDMSIGFMSTSNNKSRQRKHRSAGIKPRLSRLLWMENLNKDTEVERELKLRILRIYAKRKDFILERNLLHPNPFEKDLSPEEKAICRRFDVVMRLHSKEEHEELLKCIIEQHRILKKIHALKARAAGSHNGPSSQGSKNVPASSESIGKDSNSRITGQANPALLADLDIMAFPGADLLSESEKRLCREIKLTAPDYLKMQEILTVQIMRGGITKKSDAYPFLKIEPSKVDRIYDMLVKKGIAQP
ncbi:hypothetical protein NMG60_11022583 [Bertholletia excelsa]